MKNHLLPKVLISIICIAAVLAIMLRGDETPIYDGEAAPVGEGGAVDGFEFEPEELVYDGKGEIDFLEGVSLPGCSAQELKKIVYVKIRTSGALSSKRVEYTAETEDVKYRSVRRLHLAGYTGPKITIPQHIPKVTYESMKQFEELIMAEDDFFVDDGFGNDASDHVKTEIVKNRRDSSKVSYIFSIENIFGDRDLVTCDIVLSGEYSVIELTDSDIVLRRGERLDPLQYIARAEKADGTSALNEVKVRGMVDSSTSGNYALTYELDGQTAELFVVVE